MEHIQLPTTIEFTDGKEPFVGHVVVTPCQQGYGTTLGNALRRVLLSSLPGGAVDSLKIDGVQHEFSAVEGVHEDMIQIILNAKQVAVRVHSDTPVTLHLRKKGKGEVTAGDFDKNADVDIINPDQKIMTITDPKREVVMEMTVAKGRGFVPVSQKNTKDLPLGTIAVDSLYTPIRDIGYNVELTRVGDVTDYEKLTLMIETNGAITPKEAVSQATKLLMDHFMLLLEEADQTALSSREEKNEDTDAPSGEAEEEEPAKKAPKKKAKKEKENE